MPTCFLKRTRSSATNTRCTDSDDTFISADNKVIDLATFEEKADKAETVTVIVYNPDGASIFRID